MKKFFAPTVMVACLAAAAQAQIVPCPDSYVTAEGTFTINAETSIVYRSGLEPLAEYAQQYLPLRSQSGVSPTANVITLDVDTSLDTEAYRLRVCSERIDITGGSYGGVFYGLQSLMQLLPPQIYAQSLALPASVGCCTVTDSPEYPYRGMMIDVVRTWFDADKLKRYIDLLAYHKINVLHFPISNDEGWRLEIKSHPELTAQGAFRGGDLPLKATDGKWDERYGGYYTQEQMREIINYAAQRNITLIPEIDLPGHSRAMAQIHPEILCRYTPDNRATDGYEYRSAWCVAREENYALIEDILAEVCELFPSEYIHIGGDEVDMSQWRQCPDCRALLAREGTDDAHRLEDIFMQRAGEILARHGKRQGVWNEAAAGGGLSRDALVYGWENFGKCIDAASRGYRTVVMPGACFYFDMRQSQHEDGHQWAAIFDASRPYGVDLTAEGFTPAEQRNVVGFEGTFFSELYVSHNPETTAYPDYMLFPRVCSLAEAAWGNNDRTWDDYAALLATYHYDRMTAMGIEFRLFPPEVTYAEGKFTASTDDGSQIYYVIDGDTVEHKYTTPVATSTPELYRFISRRGTGRSPYTATVEYYKTITPAVAITSSIPENPRSPFSRAAQYAGLSRTARTCRKGDYILFTFNRAVSCREMTLATGYPHMPRSVFPAGRVEISYDGVTFERGGELTNGKAVITNPPRAIKAVRMVCEYDNNGTPYVAIQSPAVKPLPNGD